MTENPRHTTDVAHADHELTIDAPTRSRRDEPIEIRLTGLDPGESVTLEATTTGREGHEWRSSATFTADEAGVVDLSERAPEAGSYDAVAPMGWCWSMQGPEDQPVSNLMVAGPMEVSFRAQAGDRTAERTITRHAGEGVERTEVNTDGVVGTIFEPADDGPHPGVVVLHGSGGISTALTASLLADRGFAAFSLRYIGEHDALPEEIGRVPISYFDDAARWFGARDGVRGDRIGLLGHSRGAEIALALGARYDWVGAVVSYAGSGVLWNTPDEAPAWVDEDGEPLPYVPGKGKPTLLEGQLDEADAATREAATPAVEAIEGPILLITGEKDPIWPASRTAERVIDRLDGADHPYPYEHRRYEGASHFITPPYLPKNHHVFGGEPVHIARADADAWPRAIDCLTTGLDEA
ncbi:acyl-CoA thioesterase/bile acid-CoA:amino acid N-acyltransferase family protein [Halovivax limisalsi]|uniref:acyl-CoA thioesterase/bile acid-CoA:amino acid N-acyltransferase family protein n=1 Tax=Halovivax limisalsi TaxID=1453760 RepID=UPI001FFD9E19|nr:acyl-CoA thioesterase/bile acid-CoA:amino acid N-acyltransferase family protein [Halovivax limisalsi]